MLTKIIKVEEVIANFLASDEAKNNHFIKIIKGEDPDKNFRTLLKKYKLLSRDDLFSLAKLKFHHERLQRFDQHSWTIEKVELKYIGGWTGVGDLPWEWCQLSIPDIAAMIQEYSNKCGHLKSVKKIYSIKENIDVVLKYFHPILFPGGEIRKDDHLLFLPFDSDDGSHRLIAASLADKKDVLAYVGFYDTIK